MRPAARAQAAIDLLDLVISAAVKNGPAADTIIAEYFRTCRFAGSGDRRAIRELVFRAIRRSGAPPESGRAALLGLARDEPELLALFDGSPHAPMPPLAGEARAAADPIPASMREWFDPLIGDEGWPALLARAPLDLRVNRLKATRKQALAALEGAEPTPHSPTGLRLAEPRPLHQETPWREGWIEVQDEASQLASLACEARSGERVVDLCAGGRSQPRWPIAGPSSPATASRPGCNGPVHG
jgi:16S rRNA (cytosine967-C5)-methyltransferase